MVNALELLYSGLCDVIEQQEAFDANTKETTLQDVTTISQQPCRLSFSSVVSADQQTGAATVKQATKLFISPALTIPPGSKITVTQNGKTQTFKSSGEPAQHSRHQEIALELEEFA